jgi:hypothetical protein
VTYSAVSGRPLQALENRRVGLGNQSVSAPAFRPSSNVVALVAHDALRQVAGVLLDARAGTTVNTLTLSPGSGLSGGNPTDFGNGGYALRFSPNGQLLASNRGHDVVIWSLTATPGSSIASRSVLTTSMEVDPSTVAVSDAGTVSAVGIDQDGAVRFEGGGASTNVPTVAALIGDERGRLLQPIGIAYLAEGGGGDDEASVYARMGVAMSAGGRLSAAALGANGSSHFAEEYGSDPSSVLSALCRVASTTITREQWATYFPDEPYAPACPPRVARTPAVLSVG